VRKGTESKASVAKVPEAKTHQ